MDGVDLSDIKLGPSNGLNIQDGPQRTMPEKPYRGMGKEDLLHFSSRPFWRRLRMACISIVLIGWLALIITVVALVLAYPRCREPDARTWWQTGGVYRVYVPSFKDSDGDGIGDLAGIESKLDYIKDSGFNTISLSPIYNSEATDAPTTAANFGAGKDEAILDHKTIGQVYGTLADFDALVASVHDKGMYVILDFIPNQSSTRHPWFVDSSQNATGARRNFYVWKDGATAPNNWASHYGGSAWTRDPTRNEYYLHQYSNNTADLNLRSAALREELNAILKFWLDREVDGFNIRNPGFLFEDFDLRDQPSVGALGEYTSGQQEVYGILEDWRHLVKVHNKTGTEKLLMANIDGGLDVSRMYSYCDRTGIQMPLNIWPQQTGAGCAGDCLISFVDQWMDKTPSGKWANWMAGDENTARFSSQVNASYVDVFTVLTFLLPGTPVVYYGDEMGALGTASSTNGGRTSNARRLMPWDNSTHGGFCDNCTNTWIDVAMTLDNPRGPLSGLMKDLFALRGEASFRVGEYTPVIQDKDVLAFVRAFDGEKGYLVAVNISPTSVSRDFKRGDVQQEGVVALSRGTEYNVEDEVDTSNLKLQPFGALVVSWDYVAKEL